MKKSSLKDDDVMDMVRMINAKIARLLNKQPA
jgi:hypothetical protein